MVGVGVLARQIAELQVLAYAQKVWLGLRYVVGIGVGVLAR